MLCRGSLIVRNLSTLLGGENIFRAMGRILQKQADLEFTRFCGSRDSRSVLVLVLVVSGRACVCSVG